MVKIMNFKRFKEEFIFAKYKNCSFKNAEVFKGKINKKYKNVDAGKIYVRIVKYQVKKYGCTLINKEEKFR